MIRATGKMAILRVAEPDFQDANAGQYLCS